MIPVVDRIRLSLGTAMKIGLEHGSVSEHFSTAFLMTYSQDGCSANCSFCPQAVTSNSRPELLSRIGWPEFSSEEVFSKLSTQPDFHRICIQSLNYEGVVQDVLEIIEGIQEHPAKLSVCIHPIPKSDMIKLKETGIDNIGIAIDACTPALFDDIKGQGRKSPYRWEQHLAAIKEAQTIFGKNHVTTHLIVGMGETEEDVVNFLFMMQSMEVRVGLFAFTPVDGTAFQDQPPPDIGAYRRIQILRNLIGRKKITREQVLIDNLGRIKFDIPSAKLKGILGSGAAFQVTGCPGCNRPYYNERPSGPMYNYPRPLTADEIETALTEANVV